MILTAVKTWLQRKLANWITGKNEGVQTYIHIIEKKNEKRENTEAVRKYSMYLTEVPERRENGTRSNMRGDNDSHFSKNR